jgi:hypothetical protein
MYPDTPAVSFVTLNTSPSVSFDFVTAGVYEVIVYGVASATGGADWPDQQTIYGTKLVLPGLAAPGYFDRSQYSRGTPSWSNNLLFSGTSSTAGNPQEQRWSDVFTVVIPTASPGSPQNMVIGMYLQNYSLSPDFFLWGRVSIKKLPTN